MDVIYIHGYTHVRNTRTIRIVLRTQYNNIYNDNRFGISCRRRARTHWSLYFHSKIERFKKKNSTTKTSSDRVYYPCPFTACIYVRGRASRRWTFVKKSREFRGPFDATRSPSLNDSKRFITRGFFPFRRSVRKCFRV